MIFKSREVRSAKSVARVMKRSAQQILVGNFHKTYKNAVVDTYGIKTCLTVRERGVDGVQLVFDGV